MSLHESSHPGDRPPEPPAAPSAEANPSAVAMTRLVEQITEQQQVVAEQQRQLAEQQRRFEQRASVLLTRLEDMTSWAEDSRRSADEVGAAAPTEGGHDHRLNPAQDATSVQNTVMPEQKARTDDYISAEMLKVRNILSQTDPAHHLRKAAELLRPLIALVPENERRAW